MNNTQQIQERYERLFEEIFIEFEDEIKKPVVNISNCPTFKINSINGCSKPNDFKVKLYILKSSAMLNLNRLLRELPQEEKINFISIVNLKLDDLKSYKFRNYRLEKSAKKENGDGEKENNKYNLICTEEQREILERIAAYEKIWVKSTEEIQNEIEKMIIKIKREEEERIKIKEEECNNKYKTDISWEGTDTDLMELITALVKIKTLKYKSENITRKNAVFLISNFFNHPIKNPDTILSHAKERKTVQSPFLDKLKKAFIDYCKEIDEKDLPKNQ